MDFLPVWTCPCCSKLFDGNEEQPAGYAQPCNIPLCNACYFGDLLSLEDAS